LSTSPALLGRSWAAARSQPTRRRGPHAEAGGGDLQREARSEQRTAQRTAERGSAVRLARRHDREALLPARCRIRLQASLCGRSDRGRRGRHRSVPGARARTRRTAYHRRDVAARESESGTRGTSRGRRARCRRKAGRGHSVSGRREARRRAGQAIRRARVSPGRHQADRRRTVQRHGPWGVAEPPNHLQLPAGTTGAGSRAQGRF
jgi:hypothetical protein